MDPLRRYLTISLRRIWREKGYAFINVAGLAVAMACGLLIFLFVRHELSFDDFHEHAERTFRLVDDWDYDQRLTRTARTPARWGPALWIT